MCMCVPCVHVCACGCVDNAWTGTLCANTPSATCLPPVSSLGLAYASQRGGELEVSKKRTALGTAGSTVRHSSTVTLRGNEFLVSR